MFLKADVLRFIYIVTYKESSGCILCDKKNKNSSLFIWLHLINSRTFAPAKNNRFFVIEFLNILNI